MSRKHYKGAMVVDRGNTFHFYRQNKDGTWSHKPGVLPVTNKDASGKKIYVPHFADRDYSDRPEIIQYLIMIFVDIIAYHLIHILKQIWFNFQIYFFKIYFFKIYFFKIYFFKIYFFKFIF